VNATPAAADTLSHNYVCVFRGSRDQYQAALALSEVSALQTLVTDFYAPDLVLRHSNFLPHRIVSRLQKRSRAGIPSRLTSSRWRSAVPLASGRFDGHKVDDGLGKLAARKATGGSLVYSYYWHSYLELLRSRGDLDGPQVVFQVHPVASQIQSILSLDREKSSIGEALEPEEQLSKEQLEVRESELATADAAIVTSQFVLDGILACSSVPAILGMAPYGASVGSSGQDSRARSAQPPNEGPIRLLWVGQLSYRKGAHWLIEAMRLLGSKAAQLTIVSRTEPPSWLGPLPPNVVIQPGVSNELMHQWFLSHDVFVMPSLIEGYGLVYSESLAHGLPVIATPNSAARELIAVGENGLMVRPGSVEDLVSTVESLRSDRALLAHLRRGAAATKLPSWSGFRSDVRAVLRSAEVARASSPRPAGGD